MRFRVDKGSVCSGLPATLVLIRCFGIFLMVVEGHTFLFQNVPKLVDGENVYHLIYN